MTAWAEKAILAVCVLTCVVHEYTCVVGTAKLKPLPTRTNYSASGVEYDDGGMGALYNFARSFINTALPGDFPTDFINDTLRVYEDGGFGVDTIKDVLNRFKGYVAAIGVGVLFIVLVPIIGTCFCCCRMCGNCGGSTKQEITDGMHMKRRVFAVILFVLTTFTLVGNICTYVSNGRMTVALDKIESTVENNMDDIESYLDLVVEQVETIGIANLDTTRTDIIGLMNQTKLEDEISTFVLDQLSGGVLTKMQHQITEVDDAFELIKKSKDYINNFATTNSFPKPVSDTQFAAIDVQKSTFNTFKTSHLVDQVKDQVKTKVRNNLGTLTLKTGEVNAAFGQIKSQVDGVVTQIRDFRKDAKSGMNLEDYKQKARSFTETAKTYDKYRYAAASGLAGITTLVVTLQFLGLAFGSIGQGWSTEPSQRGCVSSAGGNFLMSSVGFILLFSSVLMLLTTLCFSLGALLEKFVCQPLSDDGLQLLKVADPYVPTRSALNADLSDILKDCRADKSAYTAFHLKSKINITMLDKTLDDQKQKIDDALRDVLGTLSSVGSVGFVGVNIASKLQDFKDSLSGLNFTSMRKQLTGTLNGLPATMAPIRAAMQDMLSAMTTLEAASKNIGNLSTDFETGMTKAGTDMATKMTVLMQDFKASVINIADKYVNTTKKDVQENMGRCSPVWNLYESILVVALCKYTIDSFNGFWFSIGWCLFFFMPSAVFSVKLAKHYRRMNGEEGNGNKVGHMDDPPINGY